jgi:hypothetical protein
MIVDRRCRAGCRWTRGARGWWRGRRVHAAVALWRSIWEVVVAGRLVAEAHGHPARILAVGRSPVKYGPTVVSAPAFIVTGPAVVYRVGALTQGRGRQM